MNNRGSIDSVNQLLTLLFFGIFGIFLLGWGIKVAIVYNKEPIDLFAEDTNWDELEQYQHVYANVDLMMDYYMTVGNSVEDKFRYYLLPQIKTDVSGMTMEHFIGIKTTSSNYNVYDKLSEESIRWWQSDEDLDGLKTDTVFVEGYLKKSTSDEKKLLYASFGNAYTEEELDEMCVPFVIMGSGTIFYIILIAAGAVCLIIFAIWLIFCIREG